MIATEDLVLALATELLAEIPADERACLMLQYALPLPRWAPSGAWICRYLGDDGMLTEEGRMRAAAVLLTDPEVTEHGRGRARETLTAEVERRASGNGARP